MVSIEQLDVRCVYSLVTKIIDIRPAALTNSAKVCRVWCSFAFSRVISTCANCDIIIWRSPVQNVEIFLVSKQPTIRLLVERDSYPVARMLVCVKFSSAISAAELLLVICYGALACYTAHLHNIFSHHCIELTRWLRSLYISGSAYLWTLKHGTSADVTYPVNCWNLCEWWCSDLMTMCHRDWPWDTPEKQHNSSIG